MEDNAKITDVAHLAGVSPATVSRVLTGNTNVKPKTKQRVLDVIERLNYKPNRLASNFRNRSSKLIMVILPDITSPFFSEIVRGFQEVAREHGYHVLLGNTGEDAEEERGLIGLVEERFVDGVILTTSRIHLDELQQLSEQIPLVLSCRYPEGCDIPAVSIDNVAAAREATQYLLSLDHRRIAFIAGAMQMVVNRDRLQGYRQALNLEDVPVRQAYIQEGDFSIESGYHLMRKLMAMEEPPTAVFASSDMMAVGALKYARERGIRVPEEVSIVGFDDIPLCTLVEPQLTSVGQPKYEMGAQAMRMLLQILDKAPLPRKQIVLPHQLIRRQSCVQLSQKP